MKKPCFALVILSMLFGCQPSSGAERAVTGYLEALRANNVPQQHDFLCLREKSPPSNTLFDLTDVKSWQIVEQEQVLDDLDPNAQHFLVSVRVESMSRLGYSVTRIWTFTVWDTDEFFEYRKRFADKLDRLITGGRELTNRALGQTPTDVQSSIEPPNRSDITDQPYCVTTAQPI